MHAEAEEAEEAGRSLKRPASSTQFKDTQGYTVKHCPEKPKREKRKKKYVCLSIMSAFKIWTVNHKTKQTKKKTMFVVKFLLKEKYIQVSFVFPSTNSFL